MLHEREAGENEIAQAYTSSVAPFMVPRPFHFKRRVRLVGESDHRPPTWRRPWHPPRRQSVPPYACCESDSTGEPRQAENESPENGFKKKRTGQTPPTQRHVRKLGELFFQQAERLTPRHSAFGVLGPYTGVRLVPPGMILDIHRVKHAFAAV